MGNKLNNVPAAYFHTICVEISNYCAQYHTMI